MKLARAEIRNFRSFVGDHRVNLSGGVNYFIGANNCGKSNLVSAISLALDPSASYDPDRDRPAQSHGGRPPQTRVTLTFQIGKTGPEETLLRRAEAFEVASQEKHHAGSGDKAKTYAAQGELRYVVQFSTTGTRTETFLAKKTGSVSLPQHHPDYVRLMKQFREVMRFVVIHSGEDLNSLLAGRFREILHLVIADHLGAEMTAAKEARATYLSSLQTELLDPLRSRVQELVSDLFPEISVAELVPHVQTVDETLSSVDVRLSDSADTSLRDKGTGVRGAVLISMLQYLAEQSRRSLVLAVEEPEAFLHPAAQEELRSELEQLAERPDVTLLVTTHSPYLVSRKSESSLSELSKDEQGQTSVKTTISGAEAHATLTAGLFRDAGMAALIDQTLAIPQTARAIVVTEGHTDAAFLRSAARVCGRDDLVDTVHFVPAGSAKNVVPQSLVLAGGTALPVIALLDHDDQGRAAADKLVSCSWSKKKQILSLHVLASQACGMQHDIEMEDLFASRMWKRMISSSSEPLWDSQEACKGDLHYRLNKTGKSLALEWIPGNVKPDECVLLIKLLEAIRDRVTLASTHQ